MRSKSKAQWDSLGNSHILGGIDNIGTGFAFLFVTFVYVSFISAALFYRKETDWSLILPVFIILNVLLVARWFFEQWLQKKTRETYLRNRKATVGRIKNNAVIRERLRAEGKSWHYDSDGKLQV